jgi:hypothetical protein
MDLDTRLVSAAHTHPETALIFALSTSHPSCGVPNTLPRLCSAHVCDDDSTQPEQNAGTR